MAFSVFWSVFRADFETRRKVLLLKPQKFMNLSGQVVAEYMRYYKIDSGDLIVVYDDIDMDFCRVKIRKGGGAGGHNGIKDIIQHLGTDGFSRIKIGAGRPSDPQRDISAWVLEPMKNAEMEQFRDEALPQVFARIEDLWGQGQLTSLR